MIQAAGLVLGISIVATAVSLIGTKPATAAAAAAVQVVNTSANPVPVTGTVNAAISGNVGLTSGATVKVSNTPNDPVLVEDASSSQRQFVQGNTFCNWTASSPFCTNQFFTVPADKRLVLTHVSGFAGTLNATLVQGFIAQGLAGVNLFYEEPIAYLAPTRVDRDFNGNNSYAFNHQALVTFGPNQIVQLWVTASPGVDGATFRLQYFGYLEPAL
jgi:hypothetical protein